MFGRCSLGVSLTEGRGSRTVYIMSAEELLDTAKLVLLHVRVYDVMYACDVGFSVC